MKTGLRTLCAVLCALALFGCGSTPEAKLKRGYDIISGAAQTATVLVRRDAITPDEAERVLVIGETAKQSLDAGKEALKVCRAAQTAGEVRKCDGAIANIQLGSGVLLELERYLEAHQ